MVIISNNSVNLFISKNSEGGIGLYFSPTSELSFNENRLIDDLVSDRICEKVTGYVPFITNGTPGNYEYNTALSNFKTATDGKVFKSAV
ncbi:MAG: hypothetical protein ABI721_04540 [Candidatus Dojkabacteria bacterium]